MATTITSGYNLWIHAPPRADSGELNFGTWWKMGGKLWRVSWIEKTGELYASELGTADRFVVLGHFAHRKDVNQFMRQWFEGNNLGALIHRLQQSA